MYEAFNVKRLSHMDSKNEKQIVIGSFMLHADAELIKNAFVLNLFS